MRDSKLFEIAVYRCTQDRREKEMQKKKENYIKKIFCNIEKNPYTFKNVINHFDRNIWFPWRYNEVFAWLCLYQFGTQIRADCYIKENILKRTNQKPKKYEYLDMVFEVHTSPSDSSEQIFHKIRNELKSFKKRWPFKKRFIDLEVFDCIGPHINWHDLIYHN
jgi:hypothetical protein